MSVRSRREPRTRLSTPLTRAVAKTNASIRKLVARLQPSRASDGVLSCWERQAVQGPELLRVTTARFGPRQKRLGPVAGREGLFRPGRPMKAAAGLQLPRS